MALERKELPLSFSERSFACFSHLAIVYTKKCRIREKERGGERRRETDRDRDCERERLKGVRKVQLKLLFFYKDTINEKPR